MDQQTTFRSYSIAGGLRGVGNGRGSPGWRIYPHTKLSQIKQPTAKFVFVEESEPRGYNMGSWVVRPTGNEWVDPLAIWHNKKSTLGYADGHTEMHNWVDDRTVQMSKYQQFYALTPQNEDLIYIQRTYPYEKLD